MTISNASPTQVRQRWGVMSGVLCALLVVLTGCKSAPHRSATAANAPLRPEDNPELIHVGDSLTIIFSDITPMQPAFEERVKEDGKITLLLNQIFTAAGKTRGELEKEIRAAYVPKYYVNLTVTIKPQERFYTVSGEVKSPGRQVYYGPTTVLKAVASCGDFSDFAKKTKVRLTRVNGRTFTVNCKKAIFEPRLDLEVLPNDQIWVPRTIW